AFPTFLTPATSQARVIRDGRACVLTGSPEGERRSAGEDDLRSPWIKLTDKPGIADPGLASFPVRNPGRRQRPENSGVAPGTEPDGRPHPMAARSVQRIEFMEFMDCGSAGRPP
ncbi:MAG: hypothetical protein EBS42_08395, partial [Caulobacteraceae bacterium]|nr:hypothetical protein [Caulobacteraceae bacterium]